MPYIHKTAEAKEDLINIWLYTHDTWGEAQANSYLYDLENAIQKLADAPLICRERTEFTLPVRIHLYQSHLIIYQIAGDTINIIRVLHKRMNLDDWLDEGNA